LRWRIVSGDEVLVTREQGLSVAVDLAPRLARLVEAAAAAESISPPTIESKTLPALLKLLQSMQRRRSSETILPGSQILAEAEQLSAWLAKPTEVPFYGAHRPGSFALRVPVGKGTAAVRLFVPKVDAPAPLVVALHGAGGSENLFFDGYGDGRVVKLGAERNWLVVAPRLTLGSLDVAELCDALAERFPVDLQRVAVVGHSMGAMQAVANAVRTPERFRAVAALGGGGRVRANAALKSLPFFVGVGSQDFALSGAKALGCR
jgi:predicted esterase